MNNSSIFATEANLSATPKVGDYLCGTWGYDATLLTAVVVVGVSGKSVKVREVSLNNVYHPNMGGMFWTSTPDVTKPVGDVVVKRVTPCGDGYRIKWNNYLNLYLSSPKPVECSNTH